MLPALNTLQTKSPPEETASSYWAQIVLLAMCAILGMPENSDVASRYFDAAVECIKINYWYFCWIGLLIPLCPI